MLLRTSATRLDEDEDVVCQDDCQDSLRPLALYQSIEEKEESQVGSETQD